ncbi:PadR family transcriptional regulator [Pandoraea sputorum]|uniref:Virulence activator alpha C-term n=1 Tax=Pandoraea sputorum TaxID=93222 RepID=A0A239SIZ9_9BURK|nr:PadR family transcriptional regulator [Pandoraea sputorum]AJC17180.1 PadR family transcriptional regulator [Pandoraea sputorum]SNU85400.1 Virulence activator alpha C-term [Pandoraea sputorum]VVD85713.1 PadR family transcriptional regulator [Pandoraea sputorum]VVE74900.1 PadR family transcriptional regulator [Pandoraea sputorum]BET09824.1 PadR family transcriptional regulator [Pandoraea sputorum]
MPLAHALMTSLLEKSSSGYDLARRFDKSIGFFWHATHQQIYRELARMETAGWIVSTAAPDGGRTRKRVYRVLDGGRDELLAWAATPTEPSDLRDDLMVRLRADAAIGSLRLQPELARRAALHAQKLAAYQAIETRDFPADAPLTRETALQRHILRLGVRYEQGWLDWTREALALLVQWDGPATGAPDEA